MKSEEYRAGKNRVLERNSAKTGTDAFCFLPAGVSTLFSYTVLPAPSAGKPLYTESMTHQIHLKRSYAPALPEDGERILVDGLWPRGESKVRANLTEWDKQIAPSKELREGLHQGTLSFAQFGQAYLAELNVNPQAAAFARHVGSLLKTSDVTLLYSSKNETENNAVVLAEWLKDQLSALAQQSA